MIYASLIAIATCMTVLLLTARQPDRALGALFGLTDSILWLVAGIMSGRTAVILIAAFCAACFLRPLLRGRAVRSFGRGHEQ